jgi:hypothetical protein
MDNNNSIDTSKYKVFARCKKYIAEFRQSYEKLSQFTSEATIYCYPKGSEEMEYGGMHVQRVTCDGNAIIILKIYGNEFEEWICDEFVIIGVDVMYLYSNLKNISDENTLKFYVEKARPSFIVLQTENSRSEKNNCMDLDNIKTTCINIMNSKDDIVQLPYFTIESTLDIELSTLKQTCKDFKQANMKDISIDFGTTTTKFHSSCDLGIISNVYKNNNQSNTQQDPNGHSQLSSQTQVQTQTQEKIHSGTYSLKQLASISKSSKSTKIKIMYSLDCLIVIVPVGIDDKFAKCTYILLPISNNSE